MPRLVFMAALLAATSAAAEPGCPFEPWIHHAGTPILRQPMHSAYLFTSTEIKVDADGAPNAYHPDDVGRHCTQGTGFKGLDCPANAGYPDSGWWQSVLVADPAHPGQAYVQPQPGEFAGFFVSQTSLQDPAKPRTDPARFVDSRTIPYLVFPGNFYKLKGTGILGDFGYALNMSNGKHAAFILSDIGPSNAPLGEISIALATALGGMDPNPRTGAGIPSGQILFVVFPRSAATPAWPLSPEQIQSRGSALLADLGSLDALRQCAADPNPNESEPLHE